MKEVHLDDEIMPFGSLDKTGLGWNCFEFERRSRMDSVYVKTLQCAWGENTVIAAQTGISGSSRLGAQCVIGGQVGIGEHARLDDSTIIGGQGGVLNGKHVRGGEVLWGTPVRPLKDFLVQQAYLARAAKKK